MSKYDDERRKLGLTSQTGQSKYDRERATIGVQTIDPEFSQKWAQETLSKLQNFASMNTQRAVEMANQPVQEVQEDVQTEPKKPGGLLGALNYIFRENPVARTINYPFQVLAEKSVPDAPIIRDGKFIEGTSAREEYAKRNPIESTGNPTLDKALGVAGEVGSYFLNPAAPGQGPVALYNAARNIGATRLGNAALSRIQSPTGQRIAQEALREGATAGAYAVPHSLIQGQTSPGEIARNVAIEGALGAAGGAAVGGVIEAGKGVARYAREAPLRKEINQFIKRTQQPEPMGISAFAKKGDDYGLSNPQDTRSHIVTKTRKPDFDLGRTVNAFYEKSFDNLQRVNQFDKTVEKMTGKKLSAEDRAYVLALQSRYADMISRTNLTERLVDAQGNTIGQSLKSITSKIPKQRLVDFEDYLIARHALTRMKRGERVYNSEITPEKIIENIRNYEERFPEFKQLANEFREYSDKLGQAWLVDTGIISRETWDAWKEANPFWVPMKREFDDIEKAKGTRSKRGLAGQANPVKRYSPSGSERRIISPIESMIEYTDAFVKTAKRNEVMQSIIRQLERNPGELADFAELAPLHDAAKKSSLNDLNALLQSEGVEGLLEKLDELNLEFTKPAEGFREGKKGNIVTGLVDGKPVQVKINDLPLLEALTNLNPEGRSKVIEAARKATNAVKLVTTGINPVFSLTRNIFYDIPTAFIFSKTTNNPIRFAWDLLDGVVSTFGNRKLYQDYKAMGGGHSSPIAADRNLLAQSKRSILPQREKLNLIKKAYAGLENLANVIESAPRLGEFKRTVQKEGDTYAGRLKGLYEAQDVTVNFKRHGSIAKEADAIFLYLNAALQGLDKYARAFKDNPAQVAAKAVGAITLPTIALYALNHDNPNYKKLSNYTKDRFFLFPTTGGKFIKVPKPRELGVPFGALVERGLRLLNESDPDAFRDFSESVRVAFEPPGLPVSKLAQGDVPGAGVSAFRDTIGGPFVDIAANENFAGAPIVPGYLQGASPRYQFDANTSELAKRVGDVLNVSPKQIDHLIRSYGGVVGQLGIPAMTQGADLGGTLEKQITADPVFSTDATRYFYELKGDLDRQYNDMRITGQPPKGYNDGARKYVNRIANTLGDITKAIRDVDKSNLSDREKKEKKRELTEARNDLARQAYQQIRGTAR